MIEFLQPTAIVDWTHPAVSKKAVELCHDSDVVATAKACFEFVRDQISHSRDAERDPATCMASDVLLHRTGYCYAKSHLLAALLRANGIPAGFCYQRLSINDSGPPYSLHGFNAIYLPEFGWYRVDARGNRPKVEAQFCPPREQLAFRVQSSEEYQFENIFPDPLDVVTNILQSSSGWRDVLVSLPDIEPNEFNTLGLIVSQ